MGGVSGTFYEGWKLSFSLSRRSGDVSPSESASRLRKKKTVFTQTFVFGRIAQCFSVNSRVCVTARRQAEFF